MARRWSSEMRFSFAGVSMRPQSVISSILGVKISTRGPTRRKKDFQSGAATELRVTALGLHMSRLVVRPSAFALPSNSTRPTPPFVRHNDSSKGG